MTLGPASCGALALARAARLPPSWRDVSITLGSASMLRPSAVVPSAVAFRASSASSNTHMGTCSHTIFSFCRAVRPFRPPLAQFFLRIKFPNSHSGDVPSSQSQNVSKINSCIPIC